MVIIVEYQAVQVPVVSARDTDMFSLIISIYVLDLFHFLSRNCQFCVMSLF